MRSARPHCRRERSTDRINGRTRLTDLRTGGLKDVDSFDRMREFAQGDQVYTAPAKLIDGKMKLAWKLDEDDCPFRRFEFDERKRKLKPGELEHAVTSGREQAFEALRVTEHPLRVSTRRERLEVRPNEYVTEEEMAADDLEADPLSEVQSYAARSGAVAGPAAVDAATHLHLSGHRLVLGVTETASNRSIEMGPCEELEAFLEQTDDNATIKVRMLNLARLNLGQILDAHGIRRPARNEGLTLEFHHPSMRVRPLRTPSATKKSSVATEAVPDAGADDEGPGAVARPAPDAEMAFLDDCVASKSATNALKAHAKQMKKATARDMRPNAYPELSDHDLKVGRDEHPLASESRGSKAYRQRQLKKRERDYVCQLRLAGRDISDETPAPGPAAAPAPAAQAIGALSTADQRRLQIIDESIALCWTGIRDINTFMLNAAGEVRRIQSHVIHLDHMQRPQVVQSNQTAIQGLQQQAEPRARDLREALARKEKLRQTISEYARRRLSIITGAEQQVNERPEQPPQGDDGATNEDDEVDPFGSEADQDDSEDDEEERIANIRDRCNAHPDYQFLEYDDDAERDSDDEADAQDMAALLQTAIGAAPEGS